MPELSLALILSAFIAGFLMFLAPCTLPLVPAYLAFIAGLKSGEVVTTKAHRRIIINSLLYVIGFSLVFVTFGIVAGLFGTLAAALRTVLVPVTGVLIIIFALQMLHVLKLKRFMGSVRVTLPTFMKPGSPLSALVIGMAFALGWTPCVGPLLASILLLAGTTGTVFSGALLLAVFALGLGLPFIMTAILYAGASSFIAEHSGFIKVTEFLGGLFLLLIGLLLLTNHFELTVVYGYRLMDMLGIGNLLDYY